MAGEDSVDEVLLFPRQELVRLLRERRPISALRLVLRTLAQLRERRFDLSIDFHGILKSGLLSRAAGAPVRVGFAPPFAREAAWIFANRRVELDRRRRSRYERADALVDCLGIPRSARPYRLQVEAGAREEIERQLGRGPGPVVLHPGSSPRAAHKRYSPEGYAVVARSLAERTGSPCLVVAGPAGGERVAAQALLRAAGDAARPAPPTPRFADLVALLARSRLFVGADSGPLHVASLVGTPVVQILGPTHPVENAPYRETPFRVVRNAPVCSPCRSGCAAAPCMRLVSAQSVVEAALELLRPAAGDVACPASSSAGDRRRRAAESVDHGAVS